MPEVPPGLLDELVAGAWPAEVTELVDGWRLRWTGGLSRRANSALPPGRAVDVDAVIEQVERFYRSRDAPPTVQVSAAPALADLDARLQRRGYVPTALTLVEVADAVEVLHRAGRGPQLELRVSERPTDEWFDVYWSVARPDRGPEDAARCRRVLLAPPLPTSFVTAVVDGSPAGAGQIVVDRGFAGVQCMATVPGARRRGVAGAVLDRLAALALEHGAPSLYLAVMADNPGARALYERCGFRAVHRYRYLVGQPPSAEAS